VVLVAEGGHLTTWSGPDQVARMRTFVDEQVSVIADAIRRARDEIVAGQR